MANLPVAVSALVAISARGGYLIPEEDEKLLRQPWNSLSSAEQERLLPSIDAALGGFFFAAADGLHLSDPRQIREKYGRSIEENYPEAGQAFSKFARTYWTLKAIIDDPSLQNVDATALTILGMIESRIGPIFFPTPGPVRIDPARREADQRRLLAVMDAPIDTDDFFANNPILHRDRERANSRGCLPAASLLLAAIFRWF